ncbi:MAG: PDZ domain-containing protein [Pseudanabaenaceae cyanobacterium SKYGB_i_bin29]|nr:PDZ domain-containing protein [Pseudanabaenaceae cyanobacterium SKYG29]MDW8420319.1 PDZ domain-containing protein [Pseudanabaenaceae cyanobacterium SKYGB_i_bin29]
MKFSYTLSVVPEERLLAVEIRVENWGQGELPLKMPVWTPGSYLVREYSRLVQGFRVMDGDGRTLPWQKVSKNEWRVQTAQVSLVIVNYLVFAHDLSVRTNHVDLTHAYCNGAATFMYIPGYEHHSTELQVILPRSDWRVATALRPVGENVYAVPNYHTLVDAPIEMGRHARADFLAVDKPHHWVVWGEGKYDLGQMVTDTTKIVATTCQLWGEVPYEDYWFLLHLSTTGNGGLEHKNCCSLNYNPLNLKGEGYFKFMNLVAHEYFHAWNVTRLRPREFLTLDYDRENYTTLLWFAEGVTSYYDQLIPLRAGIYDRQYFYKAIGDSITRYQHTPGRWEQTLADASFDTWIKLYRPDANSQNVQVSYYLKGELVAMLLDLQLRGYYGRSLDEVLRLAWVEYKSRGYTEADIFYIVERLADENLVQWLRLAIHSFMDLDFNYCFAPFGLEVVPVPSSLPHLGLTVKDTNGRPIVQYVEAKSPAQRAGINPGDELVAIDGFRVTDLTDRLRQYSAGDTIMVTVFQRDYLQNYFVKLETAPPERYNLVPVTNPTPEQVQKLEEWLKPLPSLHQC